MKIGSNFYVTFKEYPYTIEHVRSLINSTVIVNTVFISIYFIANSSNSCGIYIRKTYISQKTSCTSIDVLAFDKTYGAIEI